MCKKQDTKVIKAVNTLFTMDVIVMGVLLSVIGWGSLEIIGNNEALASLNAKHLLIDDSFTIISRTSETLLRLELSQEHFNQAVTEDIHHIKESLAVLHEQTK